MTVAELLDILKITKQSLGRVLRDLVEADFIIQRPGAIDRRQRLLHPTAKGEALARRLTEPQMRRIAAALSLLGPEGADMTSRFLRLMINERDRGVPTGRLPKP
jgi:DNA-binding MarR family transcriptional regulator